MQVREATVGPLSGTTAVSGCATSTSSQIDPERVGGDLRKDRVGALADLGARGEHAHGAVGVPSTATTDARWTSPEPVKPAP